MHAYLMDSSYKAGSELAQAMTLEDTDPAAAQYTEEIEQLWLKVVTEMQIYKNFVQVGFCFRRR